VIFAVVALRIDRFEEAPAFYSNELQRCSTALVPAGLKGGG
jgi:hypothetical protein